MVTKKTIGILSAFLLVASGCSPDGKYVGEYVDDHQQVYKLYENSDGTETAKYNNGEQVTFKRNEDNSIDFVSGSAGFLGGMMAGYFLSHGLSTSGGTWNNGRYMPSSPKPATRTEIQKFNNFNNSAIKNAKEKSNNNASGTVSKPSSTSNNSSANKSTTKSSVNASSNASSSSKSSSTTAQSSSKSGFGSAGARSSATS